MKNVCKGCQDRTAEPNCHGHCRKYMTENIMQRIRNRKAYEDRQINNNIKSMPIEFLSWKRKGQGG